MRAFDLQDVQIKGPGWLDSDTFDVEAKFPQGASKADVIEMLRALLHERFHLAARVEQVAQPSFALKIAPQGSKLEAPKEGFEYNWRADKSTIHLRHPTDMKDFAGYLSIQLGRPVADQTSLSGVFAVELAFARDGMSAQPKTQQQGDPPPTLAEASTAYGFSGTSQTKR
jgi:uncharacterized protein (TIGR03435 family)